MTTIACSYEQEIPVKQRRTENQTNTTCKHPVKQQYCYIPDPNDSCYDKFVCTNKKELKKWLKCAKENGSCGRLTYHPARKYLISYFDKPAYYSYETRITDTAETVREMFNLKKGALMKHDNVYDIHESYNGRIIVFNEDDIMP